MASLAELMSWSQARTGDDWSAGPSGAGVEDARPAAIETIREILREARDPGRDELAALEDRALLGRLQLLRRDGSLTRAGALLVCAGGAPRIVYRARPAAGARAEHRLERSGQGLIEEFRAVEDEIDRRNRRFELTGRSFVVPEVSALPSRAVREALVNAIAHRDWRMPEPIAVDQHGDELVVFSPGGLFEVELDRLLTAPSRTRNRQLADVLRSLRLAEREATGVDRMYIEQVRLGHRPPVFEERDGGIRVALVGGEPVAEVAAAYAGLPATLQMTARAAVTLDLLRERPSITLEELAVAAQESPDALGGFVSEAERAELLRPVAHPRPTGERAWRLADPLRATLGPVLAYYARPAAESIGLVARLARQMGVVRNQHVQDLLGLSAARVSGLLRQAQDEGVLTLAPGATPRGRGAAYVLAANPGNGPT
jgi:ATP-dependent DNA helicase RecG